MGFPVSLSSGTAVLVYSNLSAGSHHIRAVYEHDNRHKIANVKMPTL